MTRFCGTVRCGTYRVPRGLRYDPGPIPGSGDRCLAQHSRRPWEACGTSGMKVLVNGGLNLSELDGWWAEAYAPDVGWALGDGREHHEPEYDATEAHNYTSFWSNRSSRSFMIATTQASRTRGWDASKPACPALPRNSAATGWCVNMSTRSMLRQARH